MMRIIIPILLIIGAGGIFYFLTQPLLNNPRTVNPTTQAVEGGIKALMEEQTSLNQAIADIKNLNGRAQELEAIYQKIDPDQIKRLDVFLPDSVDDLQLIVDVNNIAERSGMQIKDIKVTTDLDKNTKVVSGATQATSSPITNKPTVSKMALAFTVVGTYSQLRAFLSDVTRSLRVLDVSKLSFTTQAPGVATSTQAGGNGQYQYQVELVTYWLK